MQWNFAIPKEEKKNIAELICKILEVATSVVDELHELASKLHTGSIRFLQRLLTGDLKNCRKRELLQKQGRHFLKGFLTNGFVYMK